MKPGMEVFRKSRKRPDMRERMNAGHEDVLAESAPLTIVGFQKMLPGIQDGGSNLPVLTKLTDRAGMNIVLKKDGKDKADGIAAEGNQDIGQERAGVSAGTGKDGDRNDIFHATVVMHMDAPAFIAGDDLKISGTLAGRAGNRTGLQVVNSMVKQFLIRLLNAEHGSVE